jgi:hypothetical protein
MSTQWAGSHTSRWHAMSLTEATLTSPDFIRLQYLELFTSSMDGEIPDDAQLEIDFKFD